MQQYIQEGVNQKLKLPTFMLCCVLALIIAWSAGQMYAQSAASLAASGADVSVPFERHYSAVPWISKEGVTVYGGRYTTRILNMRFEPNKANQRLTTLAVDLQYSNPSPFVVRIERNSQIHALVVDEMGRQVGTFEAKAETIAPGDMQLITMDLGSSYAGTHVSALFTDAGGNPLALGRVSMPEGGSD